MAYLIAAALIFFLGIILESITSLIAINYTKRNYLELWKHSGEPTIAGNRSLIKSWPLVKYYRDRNYLKMIKQGTVELPPIVNDGVLRFAEKLRGPFVATYFGALFTTGIALFLICVPAIFYPL